MCSWFIALQALVLFFFKKRKDVFMWLTGMLPVMRGRSSVLVAVLKLPTRWESVGGEGLNLSETTGVMMFALLRWEMWWKLISPPLLLMDCFYSTYWFFCTWLLVVVCTECFILESIEWMEPVVKGRRWWLLSDWVCGDCVFRCILCSVNDFDCLITSKGFNNIY